MNESEYIIEFNDVVFGYTKDKLVTNHVSFGIKKNEYICIIGHNGSGKSTISKLLVGLLKPSSGKILYDNKPIENNLSFLRTKIGIIFQNPDNQFVGLTVEDDLAFSLENHCLDRENIKKTIDIVSKAIGIEDLLTLPPESLSGGQKQRVAIASTLASNPNVIIFDESTAMLDPNAKEDLKNMILDLKNIYKKTIISVTHDMEEVTKADRVLIFSAGKLIKDGTPQEIFTDRDFLNSLSLDLPFSLRFGFELSRLSKKEFPLDTNIDNIVKEICKKK